MVPFRPGYTKSAECRKRFGALLLYFLIYTLYLNLTWVRNFERVIPMFFICAGLILVHLFSGSQRNQIGQAVFFPCLGDESSVQLVSDKVETRSLFYCCEIYFL